MAGCSRGGRTPEAGRVSARGREGRMSGRPSSELRASILRVRDILLVRGGHPPGSGHPPGPGRPSSGLGPPSWSWTAILRVRAILLVLGGHPPGPGRPYKFALVGTRALLLFWPPPTGQPSFLPPPSYFRFDMYCLNQRVIR
jgi:hypothetical protein